MPQSASSPQDLMTEVLIPNVLMPEWFRRPTEQVAKELVGCMLCRRLDDGRVIKMRITETEAYTGRDDPACHAYNDRRTPRTEIMYSAGGMSYVYLIYGIHYLLNVVTSVEGDPEAVLLRAGFVEGRPMREFAGPGKLTRQLDINKTLNAKPLIPDSGLWLESDGCTPPLTVKARIGIDYAGDAKHWLLRYYWAEHGSVSKF